MRDDAVHHLLLRVCSAARPADDRVCRETPIECNIACQVPGSLFYAVVFPSTPLSPRCNVRSTAADQLMSPVGYRYVVPDQLVHKHEVY